MIIEIFLPANANHGSHLVHTIKAKTNPPQRDRPRPLHLEPNDCTTQPKPNTKPNTNMELTQKYSPTEKFALGKEEGRNWALACASPEALQSLADARDPIFGWGIEAAGNGITAGDIIASILNGYMQPNAFNDMLSFGLDDFVDDPDFVTGFAEGCLIVRKWDLEAEAEIESAGNLNASADTPASACQTPASVGMKPLNTESYDHFRIH